MKEGNRAGRIKAFQEGTAGPKDLRQEHRVRHHQDVGGKMKQDEPRQSKHMPP